MLSHAFGGRTFKLKFGHHGGNQPVQDVRTGRVDITAQNHGFAVDADSLPPELEVTHINLYDQTVEGMRHRSLPVFSVQYHPEGRARPARRAAFFQGVRPVDRGRGVRQPATRHRPRTSKLHPAQENVHLRPCRRRDVPFYFRCGLPFPPPMPKLKATLPETGEITHELVDELITVGRISENIIQLEDASVSSRHAQLALGPNGNYSLKDLNSTNGTRVNGSPALRRNSATATACASGRSSARISPMTKRRSNRCPPPPNPTRPFPPRSRRPTNFANASPFRKKSHAKDPAGRYILILAVVAMLLFLAGAGLRLHAPAASRPEMEPAAPGLPSLRTPRRGTGVGERRPGPPFWQGIEPVPLRDNLGGFAPAQGTRVRTAWDAREWRVLFEVEGRAPLGDTDRARRGLVDEEAVEVFIDPVGDLEGYFEVEINPLGAVCDLVLRRTTSGWRKEFAWNVEGLASQVRRTPAGWAAELAIPFDAVSNVPPEPGTRWRVNFLPDRPSGRRGHGSGSERVVAHGHPQFSSPRAVRDGGIRTRLRKAAKKGDDPRGSSLS